MGRVEIIDGKIWCPKCSKQKDADQFYWFEGKPKSPCKDCKLQYQAGYYQENKDEIEIYRQAYYQENREDIIAKQSERDSKRQDEIKAYQAEYRQTNKEELLLKKKEYRKVKKEQDPAYKLRDAVSNAVYQGIRALGGSKNGISILSQLPYTIQELKAHLEALFEPWMTWNNWGSYRANTWDDRDPATWTWQIDHIIPQSKLPYTSMTDDNFRKCWALSNLRPYSAKQNVIDGSYR